MNFKLIAGVILVTLLATALSLVTRRSHAQASSRRIEVTARRFDFVPGEITLKKGEPVVLVLTSLDVRHGVRFAELNIETESGKNKSGEWAFTPMQTGTFIGHCSRFCGSGHGSMILTLHVTE